MRYTCASIISVGICAASAAQTMPYREPDTSVPTLEAATAAIRARGWPTAWKSGREHAIYAHAAFALISSGTDEEAAAAAEYLQAWHRAAKDPTVVLYSAPEGNAPERVRLSGMSSLYERVVSLERASRGKNLDRIRNLKERIVPKDPIAEPDDLWWPIAGRAGLYSCPALRKTLQGRAGFPKAIRSENQTITVLGTGGRSGLRMWIDSWSVETGKLTGTRGVPEVSDGRRLTIYSAALGASAAWVTWYGGRTERISLELPEREPEVKKGFPELAICSLNDAQASGYSVGYGLAVNELNASGSVVCAGSRRETPIAAGITSDGRLAVATIDPDGRDGTMLRLIDPASCTVSDLEKISKESVHVLATSPTRQQFIFDDGWDARLWDLEEKRVVATLASPGVGITFGAISPDGKLFLCNGPEWSIRVCEADTLKVVFVCAGHNGGGIEVCWNSDSQGFWSTSTDGTIRLWDLASVIAKRPK